MSEDDARKIAIQMIEEVERETNLAIQGELAKKCVSITIKYLIEEQNSYNNGSFYKSYSWQEVKKQLELL
jgi:hypothetical protein